MRHASPHRCTQQKHGETTALLPCVCTPVNYELGFTTCPCAFFVRMFCPCRCNFNKLSCVLCAALFAPLGCVSGDSRCCRLFWALIVCFYSALLVRARGPAFRLGVCLWGFPAVVCAATPTPTDASPCTTHFSKLQNATPSTQCMPPTLPQPLRLALNPYGLPSTSVCSGNTRHLSLSASKL